MTFRDWLVAALFVMTWGEIAFIKRTLKLPHRRHWPQNREDWQDIGWALTIQGAGLVVVLGAVWVVGAMLK